MANFNNNSRYVNTIPELNRSNKDFLPLRPKLNLEEAENDTFLQVTSDIMLRPDLISFNSYGNADLWWVIYEFNEIEDPLFDIKAGQLLRIPSLDRVIQALRELENV